MRTNTNAKNDLTYVSFDSAGEWARSTTPHLLVLADWDDSGNLIGLAFGGPLAAVVPDAGIPEALRLAVTPEILGPVVSHDGSDVVNRDELEAIAEFVKKHYPQAAVVEAAREALAA